MDKERKREFFVRFKEIKKNKGLLQVLQKYHKERHQQYTNTLKLELEEDQYRPYILVHEIEPNLNQIKTWIRHHFGKAKETPTESSFFRKFDKIRKDSEVLSAFKRFYENYIQKYLEDLKEILKEDRFRPYIALHQIDQFANAIKKMLEKKPQKKITQKRSLDKSKDNKDPRNQVPESMRKESLSDIFNDPRMKELREKAKGENKKELNQELKKFLEEKLKELQKEESERNSEVGKNSESENSRNTEKGKKKQTIDRHQEMSRTRALVALLSKVKIHAEKARSYATKIESKGVKKVAEDEAMRILKKEILKQLPPDSRVSSGSNYYERLARKQLAQEAKEKDLPQQQQEQQQQSGGFKKRLTKKKKVLKRKKTTLKSFNKTKRV